MALSGVLEAGGAELVAPVDAEARERAFVLKLRRRDPEAFELLVRRHQDRLFDFCVRLLGDREEAHDVLQEVFVSVHANLPRFREDARLSTWLYRIAKNHCLNRLKYLRRRGRGRSEDFEEVADADLRGALEAPLEPDAALATAHERRRVQLAIQKLEPEQRMLVALRDIEGHGLRRDCGGHRAAVGHGEEPPAPRP